MRLTSCRPILAAVALVAGCGRATEMTPADGTGSAAENTLASRQALGRADTILYSLRESREIPESLRSALAFAAQTYPDAELRVDTKRGRIAQLVGILSAPTSDAPERVAERFLMDNARLFPGLGARRTVQNTIPPVVRAGATALRLDLHADGIPVVGKGVVIVLDAHNRVVSVSGDLAFDVPEDLDTSVATLSRDQAEVRARELIRLADAEVVHVREGGVVLEQAPGDSRPRLQWRIPALVMARVGDAVLPRGYIVSIDAVTGELQAADDVTRSCDNGNLGDVVTPAERIRAALAKETAAKQKVDTCYSNIYDKYYLEDQAHKSKIYLYDGSAYGDGSALTTSDSAALFGKSICPTCYGESRADNSWTSGNDSVFASDFRNLDRVVNMWRTKWNYEGANGSGENLMVFSRVNVRNAYGIGVSRAVAFGKESYDTSDWTKSTASYATIDIAGHEFAHVVSYNTWNRWTDYISGQIGGVRGAVDEHMSDMFGAIASKNLGDESWIRTWPFLLGAELYYGKNYANRSDADGWKTLASVRNLYRGLSGSSRRAHITMISTSAGDNGAVHSNAVLLGRAAYLFTIGGFVGREPDGTKISTWPATAADFEIKHPIGFSRFEDLMLHTEVTYKADLSDVKDDQQNYTEMKAEFEKFASVVYLACKNLETIRSPAEWPSTVCVSVRNAYAGVGLMEGDRDYDGKLDSADNCPDVANADQADSDRDGVGDACEVNKDAGAKEGGGPALDGGLALDARLPRDSSDDAAHVGEAGPVVVDAGADETEAPRESGSDAQEKRDVGEPAVDAGGTSRDADSRNLDGTADSGLGPVNTDVSSDSGGCTTTRGRPSQPSLAAGLAALSVMLWRRRQRRVS